MKKPCFSAFLLLSLSSLLVVEGCAGGGKSVQAPQGSCQERVVKLAVLPFKNSSPNPSNDWLGHIAADLLTNSLRNTCGVSVISAAYTVSFFNKVGLIKTEDEVDGGFQGLRDLGAQAIIVGEHSFDGTRVKLKAAVVQAETGMALITVTEENHIVQTSNLFADLTVKILDAVNKTILSAHPGMKQVALRSKPVVPTVKSFESFAKFGSCAYALEWYEIDKAISDCARSAELDPTFWQAKIMLSRAYIENGKPMQTKRWLSDGATGAKQSGDAYLQGLSFMLTSHLTYSVTQIKENSDLLAKAISIYRFSGMDIPLAEALVDLADHYGQVAFLDQVDDILRKDWVKMSESLLPEAKGILSRDKDFLAEARYYAAESLFRKKDEKLSLLRAAVDSANRGVSAGATVGEGPVLLVKLNLSLAEKLLESGDKAGALQAVADAEEAAVKYRVKKTAVFDPTARISSLRNKLGN
ncbi:MAG: hypothetical protein Kow0090_15530 [Myxococcota bacterium]